jgi:ADP-dependent NAD(P)H-hydrate dehydratase / NAD(P)H-hydrate epimerase
MLPILTAGTIRAWDQFTMNTEPVDSWALMERAVGALEQEIVRVYPPARHPVLLLCGPGNNGGDGLGLARHLAAKHYRVTVWLAASGNTPDHERNLALLSGFPQVRIGSWPDLPPAPSTATLIMDALLGTGFQGALRAPYPAILGWLDDKPGIRISIDMPTGLSADGRSEGPCFPAARTLAFQVPRPAFFLPDSEPWIGQWKLLDIGLHRDFPALEAPETALLERADIAPLLHRRAQFGHKGNFGHALLIAGSTGMYGAARLAGEACLRSGCGKLTLHLPQEGVHVLQTALPEAMVRTDPHFSCWSQAPDMAPYQGLGIGCGIGTNDLSAKALDQVLQREGPPLVLDADALNILALHPELRDRLPANSILTPHPGEFRRLCPKSGDGSDPWQTQREFCLRHRVILILKGACTAIGLPDGRILINPTGNPGMATAGSGDVLTGVLTGLLAQGYPPEQAAMIGVYLHGLAGDLALDCAGSPEALLAGDIIKQLGRAFKILHDHAAAG